MSKIKVALRQCDFFEYYSNPCIYLKGSFVIKGKCGSTVAVSKDNESVNKWELHVCPKRNYDID